MNVCQQSTGIGLPDHAARSDYSTVLMELQSLRLSRNALGFPRSVISGLLSISQDIHVQRVRRASEQYG